MERFSPKIEIINHFDKLINRVDIDIDVCQPYYNYENYDISQLLIHSESDRKNFNKGDDDEYIIELLSTCNSSKLNLWPESTKVIDYLNQVRMRTIEELKKAQENTLQYYKLNSVRFKNELTKEMSIDELRSELFAEKFYFQIHLTQSKQRLWAFNIFTFVTDFYMSQSDIEILE